MMKKTVLTAFAAIVLSAGYLALETKTLEASRYSYVTPTAVKLDAQKDDEFEYRKWYNSAFSVGEKLTFDISYGFVTAGEAVMSIPGYKYVNGRKTFETRVEAKSLPSFDWVFKVRDRYSTFIDVDGIFPWRFEQVVREGKYSRDFSAFFDPEAQLAETSDGKKVKTAAYVHDIVSAFYYIRTLDFSRYRKGDKIKLENFYKDKTHPLEILILGRQKIEVEAGTFDCIVVEPLVVEGGLFKNEGSIKIWLSNDPNHIPVKMSTKVLIGSIDAELSKYEGVRGALTAKRD